ILTPSILKEVNASVATTSMILILFAVLLGFIIKKRYFGKYINTLIVIILLLSSIALGLYFPIFLDHSSWRFIILIYIAIAAVIPVWILLQPRDYLNSYLLIAMIIFSAVGILMAQPVIQMEAFTSFNIDGVSMFPFLFVTVACGAISGAHCLFASGTSSKQIKNELHILPVSYGAMLIESFLAIIALITVASFAPGQASASGYITPTQIFAGAIANFLTVLKLPYTLSFTLINLVLSACVLTTLDSTTRIARLAFQELFTDSNKSKNWLTKILINKYVATILTLSVAYILSHVGYLAIWPLFGSSTQLLAVIGLIICAIYLKRTNKNHKMLILPIFIMILITFSALGKNIFDLIELFISGQEINVDNILQLVIACLLFGLGVSLTSVGLKKLYSKEKYPDDDSEQDMVIFV
ncbi:carbon starvation protein CstA, partial [Candidatus Epulonipiscioides saccharophilum]